MRGGGVGGLAVREFLKKRKKVGALEAMAEPR